MPPALEILLPNGQVMAVTIYIDDPVLGLIPWDGSGGGGGGGGAVTIIDGGDVAQGSKSDAAWVSGDGTVISLLKKIASAGGSAVSIADGSDVAEGAKADTTWDGIAASASVISILKKIALGSSGSVTVTNAAGAAAVNIQDGGNSITVDGAITANAGTNLNTSLLALEAGGNLDSIVTLLNTIIAFVSNTLGSGVNTQIRSTIGDPLSIDSNGRIEINSIINSLPAGTALLGKVGIDQTTPGTTNKVTVGSDVIHVIVDSGVTSGGLTNAELRATPVPVSGTLTGTVSGSVEVKGLVNVNAPTYSEDEVAPFSMTLDGRLRTSTSPAVDDDGRCAWNVDLPDPFHVGESAFDCLNESVWGN